mgnify:CR=1 FL=1
MNLKEFGDWALAQQSVANPPPNNKYKGQCVSLIQQYLYRVFGIPFQAHGNAKDWAYNIPDGFTKVSGTPQKGDIIVYGANYPGSGGYGHIGFMDYNYKFFEQNGAKSLAVSYRDTIPSGYIAILRPNNQDKLGLNTNSNVPYLVQVTADALNVRTGPGTNYPIASHKNHCIRDKGKYTIVEVQGNWGRLKSGAGWICLDYTKKI